MENARDGSTSRGNFRAFLALSCVCVGMIHLVPLSYNVFGPHVEMQWGPVDSMWLNWYLQEFRSGEVDCYVFFHRTFRSPFHILALSYLLITVFLVQDRLPRRRARQLCVGSSLLVLLAGAFIALLNFMMLLAPLVR